ncbi:MAG: Flp family type IVb pilin [Sheuella sp.]|nr:Flp family type IVb pilin [Sheuella sp.]
MKKTISQFNTSLKSFFLQHRRQDGVTAIEYALLAALIAVVIIAGVTLLGTTLDGFFSALAVKINSYKPT